MVVGLKRDLRVEGEGTIYPQEVSLVLKMGCCFPCLQNVMDADLFHSHTASPRNFDAIGMRNVPPLRVS